MAGRKPKPTALKKLEGNPGKRELNTKEPVPDKGMTHSPLIHSISDLPVTVSILSFATQ